MRILRSVVQPLMRAMLDAGHDFPLGSIVGPELVGDHDTRCSPLSFQQFAHQAFGRLGVSPALDENVEHEAILIDGAPKPVLFASDADDDLVQMPFVAEAAYGLLAKRVGELPSEFLRPQADRLV